MNTDAILITLLVLFVVVLGVGNYCQFLKHKIKDSHSWNSENVVDDRREGESAMLMLLRQMKEIEDKDGNLP